MSRERKGGNIGKPLPNKCVSRLVAAARLSKDLEKCISALVKLMSLKSGAREKIHFPRLRFLYEGGHDSDENGKSKKTEQKDSILQYISPYPMRTEIRHGKIYV